jgi:hypothetical protein
MQNIICKIIIFALSCLIVTGCIKEKKDSSPITVINKIGLVSLNAPGNELMLNATVQIGDKIITDEKATATLLVGGNSAVRIYENTEFIISGKETGESGAITGGRFGIDKGKAMFVLEKLAKDGVILVRTPTAVASVRGTSFAVVVNKNKSDGTKGTTEVKVLSGTVRVETSENAQENRTLEDGETVTVHDENFIKEKERIPEKTMEELAKEEKDLAKNIIIRADKVIIQADKVIVKSGKPPVLKTEKAIKEYYHKLEEVNLDDGTTLIGAVIYQNSRIAKIHTSSGIIQVPTASIKNIRMR